MKKLKTIEQFEKEQTLKKEQMENVIGGLKVDEPPMTDDYDLGGITGPDLQGQYACIDCIILK